MTSSYESTAFRSYASPVDTFVAQPSVLPKTGAEELAEILETVNPTLQQFIGNRLLQEKAKGELEGELKVIEADPETLKQITKALNSTDKKAAKQILGSSRFVRTGIERRIAINQGLAQDAKIEDFFSNYAVTKTNQEGQEISVPLSRFSVTSPEFKQAMAEYREQSVADLTGVRPEFVNEFFLPRQAVAINKAFSNQVESNNEFNIDQAEDTLKDSIFSNFSVIDYDNFEETDLSNPDSFASIALEKIQQEIDFQANTGLVESVSPKNILPLIYEQGERIFATNLQKGESGVIAFDNYIRLVENLRIGPRQELKDGTFRQSKVGDYFGEDLNKIRSRLITAETNNDKFIDGKYAEAIKPKIISALDSFSFLDADKQRRTQALEDLKKVLGGGQNEEAFLEAIEILDQSRDDFFDNFDIRIINKDFISPLYALRELDEFEKSLGTTVTQEDKERLDAAKQQIKTLLGKDVLGIQRPKINDVIEQAGTLLGKDNFGSRFYEKQTSLYYSDATNALNKEIIRISKNADNLSAEEFEEQINAALKAYTLDIYKINNPNLEGTDKEYKLKTNSIWTEGRKLYEQEVPQQDRSIDVQIQKTKAEEAAEKERLRLEKERIEKEKIDAKKEETPKEEKKGIRQGIFDFFKPDDVSQNIENPVTQFVSQLQDYGINQDDAANLVNTFAASLNLPISGSEDMDRTDGVLVSGLKQMTDKFDQFNGAVSYGSGGREEKLKNDPNFITTIEKDGFSHTYADKSSQEVIDEAKNIYIDLVENNTQENVEAKYAIAQMVLTEAILSSEEDIIGVMQSVLMRVARARLGIREEPYGAYSTDIITEMLRPYQYAGLKGKTREDLLSPTPIKEDEETLKRVIDILWKKQPDQTII
jgi:hypothetical protein